MRHLLTLAVGIGCYLLFLFTLVYGISFTLGGVLPQPFPQAPIATLPALLIDLGLIALFGVQHSVMARPSWKRWWTTVVPPALERSLYVLIASCILLAIFWFWQPIPAVVWQFSNPVLRILVYGICLAGWGIAVLATFQINHFELFGLQQVWRASQQQSPAAPKFRKPFLYRFVRHPLMSGFLLVFWANPLMTVDRLIFALAMTIYILIGIYFEERDLLSQFGTAYEAYRAEVPPLIPFLRRRARVRALDEALANQS